VKKREQINIQCGKFKVPVDAEVYGLFAIHPPQYAHLDYWREPQSVFVVTHISSGFSVCEAVKPKARLIAKKLNTTLPNGDLTTQDIEKLTETYQAFVAKAKPLVKGLLS
jgi:hypothetical protein